MKLIAVTAAVALVVTAWAQEVSKGTVKCGRYKGQREGWVSSDRQFQSAGWFAIQRLCAGRQSVIHDRNDQRCEDDHQNSKGMRILREKS